MNKTKILKIMAAVLTICSTATSCKTTQNLSAGRRDSDTVELRCVRPDYLKAGDTVALISPSYNLPSEKIQKAAEVLSSWGLVPIVGPNAEKLYEGKYAGNANERLADLRWALANPSVKAIVCNRGGYGTIHLIGSISLDEIASNPKWIVGYSDITTLLGLTNRAGVMSIHGAMGSTLANGGTDSTCTLLRDLLMGQIPHYKIPAHSQNITGRATGILVGGNICTLAPNVCTQADATMGKDLILFIEEVGESMHNIDRQFNILAMNGVLDRCKGIILGDFTDCNTEFTCGSVEAMLRKYIEPLNIPLLCGFPAGHGDTNLPLVMGASVTIDVRKLGSTVQFNIQ